MCHSVVPYWIDKRKRYVHIAREQVPVQTTESRGAGLMVKQCVCSPTIHPGSFRCRHHHADYKWVVPIGAKPNHFAAASVARAL